ncbi:AAA family ATPase [Leptospira santarosai]|uniref:AAA family ATPase n=1 Tax=Leptospira santarosai TaxID=28183 RepID=UPI0002972C71|nr:AAA family ATPase [Leptospira santarosai]EKS07378.1 RecF/RecN/SMC N-terminal domain protein [Leptospira santarosai str. JET]
MSKTKSYFKRFINSKWQSFSEYEKKLVKIIYSEINKVKDAGSASGKRGKLITKLISEQRNSINSDLLVEEETAVSVSLPVSKLSKLTVENFRGFTNEIEFEFKNRYIYIYGPNGTGKSSLCEALEYSLLGSIKEADAKRITIREYIQNVSAQKVEPPKLIGTTSAGITQEIVADSQLYEFCFIEKNRIDGFARVSAATAQTQQERLSALFGIEEFNQFVGQFNDSIEKYIDDIQGKDTEVLEKKKLEITAHKSILDSVESKKENLIKEGAKLLEKYPTISSVKALHEYLFDTDDNKGEIKKQRENLSKLKEKKEYKDPGVDEFLILLKDSKKLIYERKQCQKFIESYKNEISLKNLYEAILGIQGSFENNCPACESVLYENDILLVPKNPYNNAKDKVKEFANAIEKENRIVEIETLNSAGYYKIKTMITEFNRVAIALNSPIQGEISTILTDLDSGDYVSAEFESVIDLVREKQEILKELKLNITTNNSEVLNLIEAIQKNESKLVELEKDSQDVIGLQTQENVLMEDEQKAKTAIDKFEEENKDLISAVEIEKKAIEEYSNYKDSYLSLMDKLKEYNLSLPLSLVANLNTLSLKFYNDINRYDHVSDLLKNITLPANPGENIQILFKDGRKGNALHILSEGHIRCMGLAILLAKAAHDNVPFIIFDDIVNAIDNEHRKGIVETLTEDIEMKEKQLIITTHGEEFLKQLENVVPASEYQKLVTRFDLLVPDISKTITVKLNTSLNYLILSRRYLNEYKLRDSLANCRRALEYILSTLWGRISKLNYNVSISVQMRNPKSSPELQSVANSLKKFILNQNVTKYKNFIPLIDEMLGKGEKNQLKWNYLNKGTHEEDREEEFDKVVVSEIVDCLDKMDALL